MKRAFDFIAAVLGLLILSPFFLLIALFIKSDSRGPVFFMQERVGINGSIFKLFKFRTMVAEAYKGAAITIGKHDARITRTGNFLRTYKLDELPQLINVVLGEMSLVGPRPEVKKFVDLYTADQRKVLSIRPGITDYASIQFRNENELLEGKPDPIDFYIHEIMPVKLRLNLEYINNRSFMGDLGIVFKTIFSVGR